MIRMIPVLPRHRVVLKKEQLGDTCMQPSEEKWRKTGEENWRNILFQRINEVSVGKLTTIQVEHCFADAGNVLWNFIFGPHQQIQLYCLFFRKLSVESLQIFSIWNQLNWRINWGFGQFLKFPICHIYQPWYKSAYLPFVSYQIHQYIKYDDMYLSILANSWTRVKGVQAKSSHPR